ncbi:DJ-1/PfpI family protein [Methylocystis heyeri]|uniref:DJ-1/PfpI family protein n=1 Tax=Methylocystis heyeri TaxID=391905 RepID=A0A6B8KH05_9HYPH|nr:DJ-1/PfpI family protein [Methylocystis heyeri]QGM46245.1 DJ-1/PfpI family protein [Methylocystis heyeri]
MSAPPFTIVFALYDGMTQLDFTGPHEFLSRAPGAETILASRDGGAVKSERLEFNGTVPLASVPACDLICVPGGLSATTIACDPVFTAEIRRLGLGARYVTSVCTGSFILGAAGLLLGKRAACHWAWRELLPLFGAFPVAARVVRDGDVITGGGVTAGIDFALTVLAEISGDETAQAIQLGLEYDPRPPFESGSPESAPPEILARCLAANESLKKKRRAEAEEAARLWVTKSSI